jgi:hypothetical protein
LSATQLQISELKGALIPDDSNIAAD